MSLLGAGGEVTVTVVLVPPSAAVEVPADSAGGLEGLVGGAGVCSATRKLQSFSTTCMSKGPVLEAGYATIEVSRDCQELW